jgi:hypothetical protein
VTPELRCPEYNKRQGVCYALTSQGIELPVVDVTHPAFELRITPERQRELVESFLQQQRRYARLPKWLRAARLRFALRGSTIARGLRRAEGTFLDGMTTYLFKLGPKNLGSYAVPIDRKIAASLPGIAVRLRLSDMARLLAGALAPQLRTDPRRPAHFLNIAGGSAIDSLNALILLAREQRELLSAREIVVCVLDGDAEGPAFGGRALSALCAPNAALAGLDVSFRHIRYDWQQVAGLEPVLEAARAAGAITIGSSEGGLFEYGSDLEIVSNLKALARAGTSFKMVGSVTRNDETMQTLKLTSTAATRPRGLRAFAVLAAQAGFRIAEAIQRPLSDQVVLESSPDGASPLGVSAR